MHIYLIWLSCFFVLFYFVSLSSSWFLLAKIPINLSYFFQWKIHIGKFISFVVFLLCFVSFCFPCKFLWNTLFSCSSLDWWKLRSWDSYITVFVGPPFTFILEIPLAPFLCWMPCILAFITSCFLLTFVWGKLTFQLSRCQQTMGPQAKSGSPSS